MCQLPKNNETLGELLRLFTLWDPDLCTWRTRTKTSPLPFCPSQPRSTVGLSPGFAATQGLVRDPSGAFSFYWQPFFEIEHYGASQPNAVTDAYGYTIGYDGRGLMVSRSKDGENWSFGWAPCEKPWWIFKGEVGHEYGYTATCRSTGKPMASGTARRRPSFSAIWSRIGRTPTAPGPSRRHV